MTNHSLYAAGNLAMVAYNIDSLGIKAVAKRAAKDTGKAVLQDIEESKKDEPSNDRMMASDDGKKKMPE